MVTMTASLTGARRIVGIGHIERRTTAVDMLMRLATQSRFHPVAHRVVRLLAHGEKTGQPGRPPSYSISMGCG
jgi:hypothetical protein